MKPELNRRIFWDVNPESIDFTKNAPFIIQRVFERGDVEDVRSVRRFYGDEKVLHELKSARWLMKDIVYLASAIFKCPLNEFKCYRIAASNPEHWLY